VWWNLVRTDDPRRRTVTSGPTLTPTRTPQRVRAHTPTRTPRPGAIVYEQPVYSVINKATGKCVDRAAQAQSTIPRIVSYPEKQYLRPTSQFQITSGKQLSVNKLTTASGLGCHRVSKGRALIQSWTMGRQKQQWKAVSAGGGFYFLLFFFSFPFFCFFSFFSSLRNLNRQMSRSAERFTAIVRTSNGPAAAGPTRTNPSISSSSRNTNTGYYYR